VKLPITPYGLVPVAATSAACIVLAAACYLVIGAYAFLILFPAAFVVSFFRDPERHPDENSPRAVLAPADGRIVAITDGRMPSSGAPASVVDIFLSIFDVHLNRAPMAGRVVETRYRKGLFLNALRASAADLNESNVIVMEVDSGRQLAVRQIAGVIARRIVCAVSPGDYVEAGQRLGMIRFGSRTQLYIPAEMEFRPDVAMGQHVRAGKSVLGHVK